MRHRSRAQLRRTPPQKAKQTDNLAAANEQAESVHPGATGINRIEHAEIADLKLWLLNIPPDPLRHVVGHLSDHLSDDTRDGAAV